jgi:hypothetical protein
MLEFMFENNILESSRDWAGMESSSLHPLFSVKTLEKAKLKVYLIKHINSNNPCFR